MMDHLVSRSIKPQVGVVLSTYDVTYFVNPRLSSDTTPSAYVHFNMEGRATLHLKGSLLATAQAGWSPISEPVTASLNQSRRLHMQPVDMDKITTWPRPAIRRAFCACGELSFSDRPRAELSTLRT